MLTHARRAVPWALVASAVVLLVAMLAIVGRRPWTMWPLQGVAVGLLAGASAWCLDDPSPEIADAAPRHLRWRGAAQGIGVLALLAAWTAGVLVLGGDLFGHAGDVLAQGYAASIAALGLTAWLRSRGPGHPGRAVATAAVSVCLGLALARPAPGTLAFFPYSPAGPWTTGRILWAGVAGAGVLALARVLGEATWRSARQARREPTERSAPHHSTRGGGGRKCDDLVEGCTAPTPAGHVSPR